MKCGLLMLFVLFPSFSFAEGGSLKILQILKTQHTIVAEGSESSPPKFAEIYLVNFPDNHQCEVILRSAQGNRYTFDTASCDREGQLKKNLTLERSLVAVQPAPTKQAPAPIAAPIPASPPVGQPVLDPNKATSAPASNNDFKNGIRFGLALYYNLSDEITFNDTIGNDVEFQANGAFGLGARLSMLNENSWGFIFGLDYEMERKIDAISGGGITTGFSEEPKLSFLILDFNAAYRWELIYLPFGLNYSIPTLSKADGEKLEGTVGANLGVGFMVTPHSSIEVLARSFGVKFKDDDTDEILGVGFLAGVTVKSTFWF